MGRNYFLWIVIIALGCLVLIFFSVGKEINKPITKESLIPSPKTPFKTYISGVGIVEPSSENIFIGTTLNRAVEKVYVSVGEKIKKGQPLIKLEDRDLQANLEEQKAVYNTTLAKLNRLEALPRSEDAAEANASLKSAEAALELAKKQYEMTQNLNDPRAISLEEKNRRQYHYQEAQAKFEQTQADARKTKAGAWKPDLEIAQLEIQQTKANIQKTETEIARTIIQSPIDGTVLQIKIHEGEYPSVDNFRTPLMILGNIDTLHLRVSINQLDIPLFSSTAQAVAYLQDDDRTEIPLEFVKIEPFLIAKQSFNNAITEKVDTRVLQIIYSLQKNSLPIFVGQQMDVFIHTKAKE